jgi:hypothetical protein
MLQGRELHELDFAVPEGAVNLARTVSDRLGGAFVLLDEQRDIGRVVLRNARRGPVSIDFARFRGESITEDLGLRDFTINAMALDVGEKESAQVIDPLGGQADLAAGIIRVTSPRAIGDDPVRALRAVRLAGELGFALAPATARLIGESASLLDRVSGERLRDELCKILAQPNAARQLRALTGLGLLEPTLPEVAAQARSRRPDLLECAVEWVAALEALLAAITLISNIPQAGGSPGRSGQPEMQAASQALTPFSELLGAHLSAPTAGDRSRLVLLKLATLLCGVGKPEGAARLADTPTPETGNELISATGAEKIARRLRFSKNEARLVRAIVGHHGAPYHLLDETAAPDALTRRAAYRFFRDTGGAGLDVLLVSLADHLARQGCERAERLSGTRWNRHLEVVAFLLKTYRDQRQTVISPPPLITGHEVMRAFALSAGPRLGRILDRLREEQAAGEVVDREGALAHVAQMLSAGPGERLPTDDRGKMHD